MKNKKEYEKIYYVPDGTKTCGYYECKKCGNRFLSLQTMEKIPCPDCEAEVDYEIGPGESLEDVLDTAVLLQKIEGEEEVEKMDALLSLAITGGDFDWIRHNSAFSNTLQTGSGYLMNAKSGVRSEFSQNFAGVFPRF